MRVFFFKAESTPPQIKVEWEYTGSNSASPTASSRHIQRGVRRILLLTMLLNVLLTVYVSIVALSHRHISPHTSNGSVQHSP